MAATTTCVQTQAKSLNYALLQHGELAFKPFIVFICRELGLLDALVSASKLELFANRVISLMRANKYHNLLHVLDVVQATYAEIQGLQEVWHQAGCSGLSKLEQLAAVIAAAAHDLSHPGTTNQHQLAVQEEPEQAGSQISAVYVAKNELMHAETCCKILEETGLLDQLSVEDRSVVTNLVSKMILHTDMSLHFKLLQQFNETKASRGGVAGMTSAEDHQLLCCVLLHMADVSNPARPWDVAYHMATAITAENMIQFATEQELTKLGKVASDNPFLTTTAMAPSYDKMPKGQRFFVTTFVKPLLDTLADVIPTFYDEGKANLQRNLERWDAFTNNTIV